MRGLSVLRPRGGRLPQSRRDFQLRPVRSKAPEKFTLRCLRPMPQGLGTPVAGGSIRNRGLTMKATENILPDTTEATIRMLQKWEREHYPYAHDTVRVEGRPEQFEERIAPIRQLLLDREAELQAARAAFKEVERRYDAAANEYKGMLYRWNRERRPMVTGGAQ